MENDLSAQPSVLTRERLERLSSQAGVERNYNKGYSVLIRRLRILLPLLAVCILAVVFSWSKFQNPPVIAKEEKNVNAQAARNELLNPRFDSVDSKNQPYAITAAKAVQAEENDKILLLEKPLADIALESGNWIALQSGQGAYNQQTRRLLLKDSVTLFHDDGYAFRTAEMDIDMEAESAWSQSAVEGHGPSGLLNASGFKADSKSGTLIFSGPAKLVLFRAASNEGSKGHQP